MLRGSCEGFLSSVSAVPGVLVQISSNEMQIPYKGIRTTWSFRPQVCTTSGSHTNLEAGVTEACTWSTGMAVVQEGLGTGSSEQQGKFWFG